MADLIPMLAAAAGAAAGGGEVDPNFNQTVLLLHGDGSDGAQNNTFLDSSTNNFTITRAGNTTQGTFSPFSAPDGRWSNYFDPSGDSLAVPYGSDLALGTGDCTIEAWVYIASFPQQYNVVCDVREGSGTTAPNFSNNAISLVVENNGAVLFSAGSYSAAAPLISTASGKVSLNTWCHICVLRSSGTTKIYVNGVEEASSANAWNQTSGSATTFYLGYTIFQFPRPLNAYVSNFRIVKGTAITPPSGGPTSPLTAVSGTELLTCQSNRFVDNSSNAFAITRNGDVKVTPFSPFAPTAAYSSSVNGGSGYFDGTGDYLTAGSASDWTFLHNGSDWTIQFSIYYFSTTSKMILGTTASSQRHGMGVYIEDATNKLIVIFARNVSGSLASFVSDANLAINQWNNVSITFENSTKTCSFYINGVASGSSSNTGFAYSATDPTHPMTIGAAANSVTALLYTGYMSSIRISDNVRTGLTSNPTAPYTSDADTVFLANFTNAGIFDNTGKNNLETVGNAQIDTTTKQFGTGSMEFDGTGDWLKVPNSPDIQLGTGDFTIEFWVYLASGDTGSNRGLVAKGGASTGWLVSLNTTEKVVFTYTTSTITSSGAITTNAWNHIAVVREGTGSNETKIYIGGTNDGTGTVNTDFNQTEIMYIGANRAAGDPMKGFIDDLRITKGVARYTTTFTPPTKAFPDL